MNGGGAERVVSILLEDLVKKYEVHLVVFYEGLAYQIPNQVKMHYLANCSVSSSNLSKIIYLPYLGFKYYRYCKQNKIDISLSLLNRANYINILSKHFGAKHKTIISERTPTAEFYPENSIRGFISRALVKLLYPYTDSIIAISKGVAADLANIFGIHKDKIRTIYNPINIEAINAELATIKKNDKNLSSHDFTYISVGRLDEKKNFDLLLQAFSILNKSNTKLIILGDGPLREKLRAKINELNLNDSVTLLGFASNIFTHLYNADCFVLPSNCEGFGNVIIEALACGKPVISTDCKYGPSEILAEQQFPVIHDHSQYEFSKYGVLVPLNNPVTLAKAMRELADNDVKRESYELVGPQRAQDFNKQNIASQYLEMLEKA